MAAASAPNLLNVLSTKFRTTSAARITVPKPVQQKITTCINGESIALIFQQSSVEEVVDSLHQKWGHLDADAFTTVLKILLASDPCQAQSEGFFRCLDVLEHYQRAGTGLTNLQRKGFKSKAAPVMSSLLSFFLSSKKMHIARRWAGLLLFELLEFPENRRVFMQNNEKEETFRSIGRIVVIGLDKLLKIVAGKLIAQLIVDKSGEEKKDAVWNFVGGIDDEVLLTVEKPFPLLAVDEEAPAESTQSGFYWDREFSDYVGYIETTREKMGRRSPMGFSAISLALGADTRPFCVSGNITVSMETTLSIHVPPSKEAFATWIDIDFLKIEEMGLTATGKNIGKEGTEEATIYLAMRFNDREGKNSLFLMDMEPQKKPDTIMLEIYEDEAEFILLDLQRIKQLLEGRTSSQAPLVSTLFKDIHLTCPKKDDSVAEEEDAPMGEVHEDSALPAPVPGNGVENPEANTFTNGKGPTAVAGLADDLLLEKPTTVVAAMRPPANTKRARESAPANKHQTIAGPSKQTPFRPPTMKAASSAQAPLPTNTVVDIPDGEFSDLENEVIKRKSSDKGSPDPAAAPRGKGKGRQTRSAARHASKPPRSTVFDDTDEEDNPRSKGKSADRSSSAKPGFTTAHELLETVAPASPKRNAESKSGKQTPRNIAKAVRPDETSQSSLPGIINIPSDMENAKVSRPKRKMVAKTQGKTAPKKSAAVTGPSDIVDMPSDAEHEKLPKQNPVPNKEKGKAPASDLLKEKSVSEDSELSSDPEDKPKPKQKPAAARGKAKGKAVKEKPKPIKRPTAKGQGKGKRKRVVPSVPDETPASDDIFEIPSDSDVEPPPKRARKEAQKAPKTPKAASKAPASKGKAPKSAPKKVVPKKHPAPPARKTPAGRIPKKARDEASEEEVEEGCPPKKQKKQIDTASRPSTNLRRSGRLKDHATPKPLVDDSDDEMSEAQDDEAPGGPSCVVPQSSEKLKTVASAMRGKDASNGNAGQSEASKVLETPEEDLAVAAKPKADMVAIAPHPPVGQETAQPEAVVPVLEVEATPPGYERASSGPVFEEEPKTDDACIPNVYGPGATEVGISAGKVLESSFDELSLGAQDFPDDTIQDWSPTPQALIEEVPELKVQVSVPHLPAKLDLEVVVHQDQPPAAEVVAIESLDQQETSTSSKVTDGRKVIPCSWESDASLAEGDSDDDGPSDAPEVDENMPEQPGSPPAPSDDELEKTYELDPNTGRHEVEAPARSEELPRPAVSTSDSGREDEVTSPDSPPPPKKLPAAKSVMETPRPLKSILKTPRKAHPVTYKKSAFSTPKSAVKEVKEPVTPTNPRAEEVSTPDKPTEKKRRPATPGVALKAAFEPKPPTPKTPRSTIKFQGTSAAPLLSTEKLDALSRRPQIISWSDKGPLNQGRLVLHPFNSALEEDGDFGLVRESLNVRFAEAASQSQREETRQNAGIPHTKEMASSTIPTKPAFTNARDDDPLKKLDERMVNETHKDVENDLMETPPLHTVAESPKVHTPVRQVSVPPSSPPFVTDSEMKRVRAENIRNGITYLKTPYPKAAVYGESEDDDDDLYSLPAPLPPSEKSVVTEYKEESFAEPSPMVPLPSPVKKFRKIVNIDDEDIIVYEGEDTPVPSPKIALPRLVICCPTPVRMRTVTDTGSPISKGPSSQIPFKSFYSNVKKIRSSVDGEDSSSDEDDDEPIIPAIVPTRREVIKAPDSEYAASPDVVDASASEESASEGEEEVLGPELEDDKPEIKLDRMDSHHPILTYSVEKAVHEAIYISSNSSSDGEEDQEHESADHKDIFGPPLPLPPQKPAAPAVAPQPVLSTFIMPFTTVETRPEAPAVVQKTPTRPSPLKLVFAPERRRSLLNGEKLSPDVQKTVAAAVEGEVVSRLSKALHRVTRPQDTPSHDFPAPAPQVAPIPRALPSRVIDPVITHDHQPQHEQPPCDDVEGKGPGSGQNGRFFEDMQRQGLFQNNNQQGDNNDWDEGGILIINEDSGGSSPSSSSFGSSDSSEAEDEPENHWADDIPDYHRETLGVLDQIAQNWILYLMSSEEKLAAVIKDHKSKSLQVVDKLRDLHALEHEKFQAKLKDAETKYRECCRITRKEMDEMLKGDGGKALERMDDVVEGRYGKIQGVLEDILREL